ncbi:hypothetical protein [Mycobacteroides abscessus]|uniref:hypothetical protein n=1 Tax=Mycobacteroides abscessus TaxID=36809 RepID=UPI000925C0F2|nr:hypothetical protein [Mycobacteroides abscessus]SIM82969.1 Uncharacterised protein [Mycobacteroides abscessus subsp. abscessus]SLI28073.1 Uncharacterised protein [Mycobacteroides abscessus subsp. abscessus]
MSANNAGVIPDKKAILSDADLRWLDAQGFSHIPTHDRREAVTFLNDVLGAAYRQGAVAKAFDDREIPTALVSGVARASAYDLAAWTIGKKYRHLTQAG